MYFTLMQSRSIEIQDTIPCIGYVSYDFFFELIVVILF